jgi:hypothetical protein
MRSQVHCQLENKSTNKFGSVSGVNASKVKKKLNNSATLEYYLYTGPFHYCVTEMLYS